MMHVRTCNLVRHLCRENTVYIQPRPIYRVSHKFVLTFDVPRKEGKFYIMTFSYHAMCSSENV